MKYNGKNISLTTWCSMLCICILMMVFAGCGKKNPAPDDVEKKLASESKITKDFNSQLFASANITPDRSDYILGAGDLLEIRVFEADKLNATARVSSRGEVSLPLLGEVNLKGKTASEAETLIETSYKRSYIKDPHVSIFVKEHYSQRVTVIGQVKSPGTYDYPSKQRLMDAIALAGGLNDKAGYMVQIRRHSGMTEGSSQQTVQVDLQKLITEGKEEQNIDINGGDVIFVPEAGSYYVDGAVRKPGQYFIKNILSINEALMAAGGLAPYANPEKLVLMRKTDTGIREEILINMEEEGEKIETMTIEENDVLYVNASFWGKVFSGGGVNLGIPGMGVTYHDPER
jgi:polysaccharide export outer membrane protein